MPESRPDARETASLCYAMAYFVLPHYIYHAREKLLRELAQGQALGAFYFYVLTCQAQGKEPDSGLVRSFVVYRGRLNDDLNYHVIQYPPPPPVDLSDLPDEQWFAALRRVVLAPYFSALIEEVKSGDVRYFVLGQSPDGLTTFRSVTPAINANLGRGCEPEIGPFLALLRQRAVGPAGGGAENDDEAAR